MSSSHLRSSIIFCSLTLLLNVSLTLFIVQQVERLHQAVDEIADNGLPSVQTTLQMQSTLAKLRITELHHILSLNAQTMTRYEKDLDANWAQLTTLLARYEPLISSQEERENFIDFKRLLTAYTLQESRIIPLSKNNADTEASALLQGEALDLFEQAMAKLTRLFNINEQNNARANLVIHTTFQHAVKIMLAIQGILFLVNIGFILWISRRALIPKTEGHPVLT